MHISGTIHHKADQGTLSPFRIAVDASLYCHRKDAGRAKNMTAQAEAVHTIHGGAEKLWTQAAAEWEAIGMDAAARACRELAETAEVTS